MVAAALLRVDKVPEPQVADHGSPASSWSGDKGPEVEQSKEKRRWCGALGELWIPLRGDDGEGERRGAVRARQRGHRDAGQRVEWLPPVRASTGQPHASLVR